MSQKLTEEVQRKTCPDSTLPWIGAIGLAFAVGIVYLLASQLSLALLAKPDGVAVFWPAAGRVLRCPNCTAHRGLGRRSGQS